MTSEVFGAAILEHASIPSDSDNLNDKNQYLKTVLAGTNAEMTCPLFHGEMHVIYQWCQKVSPSERGPTAQRSIFLSTHEPCCMCISGIVWSGFPKVFYLFPYTMTSDQGIPHDINTMHELWGVNSYRKQNKYCSTACLIDLIDNLDDNCDGKKDLVTKKNNLIKMYETLSNQYHSEKESNADNSLVLS